MKIHIYILCFCPIILYGQKYEFRIYEDSIQLDQRNISYQELYYPACFEQLIGHDFIKREKKMKYESDSYYARESGIGYTYNKKSKRLFDFFILKNQLERKVYNPIVWVEGFGYVDSISNQDAILRLTMNQFDLELIFAKGELFFISIRHHAPNNAMNIGTFQLQNSNLPCLTEPKQRLRKHRSLKNTRKTVR